MRQALTDDDLLARSYAVTHPSGAVVLPHQPGWDQLLYAASGVMRVEAGTEVWVVPPHRALWLPDRRRDPSRGGGVMTSTRARIVMHGRVAVRTLYVRIPGLLTQRIVAVDVLPLLRELILHAVRSCPLEHDRPDHRRVLEMIGDRLAVAPHAPLQLPTPADARAAALAHALAADPSAARSVDQLATEARASRRTLERLFLAETGMTIGQWRQRLRLVRALELLAAGEPVTAVASAVGYSTPSAFTAMFRAQLGEPPGRYLSPGRRGA
jgi:AraC-like DNA-binding protein